MLIQQKRVRALSSLLMAALILFSGTAAFAKTPLHVITSFTIIEDMAKNVAGDRATVESVIKPGVDLHDYQPTPKDVAKVGNADLILWNGLEMEQWFARFFKQKEGTPIIIVSDGIMELLDSGDGHGSVVNPHAWMNLKNGMIYVDNIAAALATHDPENADYYAENAAQYKAKIAQLDQQLVTAFKAIPTDQRWIVTNESSMSYFADRYGFNEAYIWNAFSDEEGTPQQVRNLITLVREQSIPVLFSESTMSSRAIKQIAKESGARYGGEIYTDSLSVANGPVPTYLKLLEVTGGIILKAYNLEPLAE